MVAGRTIPSGQLAHKPAPIKGLGTLPEKHEVGPAQIHLPLLVAMSVEELTLMLNSAIRKFLAVSYFRNS